VIKLRDPVAMAKKRMLSANQSIAKPRWHEEDVKATATCWVSYPSWLQMVL
jgi:hypothetical protein